MEHFSDYCKFIEYCCDVSLPYLSYRKLTVLHVINRNRYGMYMYCTYSISRTFCCSHIGSFNK